MHFVSALDDNMAVLVGDNGDAVDGAILGGKLREWFSGKGVAGSKVLGMSVPEYKKLLNGTLPLSHLIANRIETCIGLAALFNMHANPVPSFAEKREVREEKGKRLTFITARCIRKELKNLCKALKSGEIVPGMLVISYPDRDADNDSILRVTFDAMVSR